MHGAALLLHASAWCSIVVARRSAHCAAAGWQRRPAPCTLACLQGYQVPGAACCCTHWYCRQELVPACSKCHPHQGDLCHTTDESSPLSTTCHFFFIAPGPLPAKYIRRLRRESTGIGSPVQLRSAGASRIAAVPLLVPPCRRCCPRGMLLCAAGQCLRTDRPNTSRRNALAGVGGDRLRAGIAWHHCQRRSCWAAACFQRTARKQDGLLRAFV